MKSIICVEIRVQNPADRVAPWTKTPPSPHPWRRAGPATSAARTPCETAADVSADSEYDRFCRCCITANDLQMRVRLTILATHCRQGLRDVPEVPRRRHHCQMQGVHLPAVLHQGPRQGPPDADVRRVRVLLPHLLPRPAARPSPRAGAQFNRDSVYPTICSRTCPKLYSCFVTCPNLKCPSTVYPISSR